MSEKSLKEKPPTASMWGGISNGAQQLLNLVFGIFLARLLSPADYGMVGMLTIFTPHSLSPSESGFISGLNRKKKSLRPTTMPCSGSTLFAASASTPCSTFVHPLIAAWFREPVLVPFVAPFVFEFRHLRTQHRTRALASSAT